MLREIGEREDAMDVKEPETTSIATLVRAVAASRLVDLTHRMEPGMPVWPTHPHFCQNLVESYAKGDASCWHSLSLGEHTGTHFDAPLHFVPGGASIDAMPVEKFFGRMVTIAAEEVGPGASVQPSLIAAWEKEHGTIRPGDAVFFHFGWDRHWRHDRQSFLQDWPGLSGEACAMLAERQARIVGTDCLSIDPFINDDFPAHHTLLAAGILIGENFDRLGEVPSVCYAATLPLPIGGGSGAPLRAVAFIP
jgi:arylformamidase